MRPEKIFLTALITVFCAAVSNAAPEMIVLSSATYDSGALDDRAYALTTDADGNVFLTGASGNDYLSMKYNKALVQGPAQLFTEGSSGNIPGGIVLDGLGNIVIAGMETNASQDYLVLKYSPNFASLLSSASYNGGNFDRATGLKIDSQNNIFVTGYSNDGTTDNFYTIKYNPALSTMATASYDSGYMDQAAAIAVTGGNVIVVGLTKEGGTNYNFRIVKYDSNLNELDRIFFDSGGDDRATGVVVDSAENIIVTGKQDAGLNPNYCTLKYDSFLNLLSSAVYDSGGTDIPTGVAVDSNDNIIVTGHSANNYFTIKYDRNFNVISSATYDGELIDKSNAVAVDADDNVIVTGVSGDGATDNYFTIKYNASPKITEVSPLYIGENFNVRLKGKGFLPDSVVSFADPSISTGTISIDPLQITLAVTPSAAVLLGVTTVTVTNANGESFTSASLAYTRLRKTVPASQAETITALTGLGQVTVDVLSGAFPQQETITIYTVPAAAGDLRQVGEALYLSVAPSSSPLVNISIKLRYSVADLGGYPESALSLAYDDPVEGWVGVTSSVNTSEKSVTGLSKAVNTRYAVVKAGQSVVVPVPGGLGGAKVYPNPYRPGSGGDFDQSTLGDGIVFASLGAGQAFKLTIVDIAGQLVFTKSATADSSGKYFWDTKTVSGGKAASGVYIYIIKGGGEPKKGKFSIIR